MNTFRKNELARRYGLAGNGALLFFIGTIIAAGLNFLYQALMSRMLGPDFYGALGSLIALTTVITLVASALQAAITHAVASSEPREGESASGIAFRRPLAYVCAAAIACFVAITATSPLFEHYLHLDSLLPVILFGLFVAITLVGIIPQGMLFGRLRFSTVAMALVANAAVRCVAGVVLVELNLGLNGAMAAAALGSAVQLLILVHPVRLEMLRVGTDDDHSIEVRAVVLAVVAIGGVSTFIGIDSFMARHFLSRIDSGYYVAAATGAKIALFLPAAITQMAFPRLTRVMGDASKIRRVLTQNLKMVAALGVVSTIAVALFSHLLVSVLFGHRFDRASNTIGILGLSSAELGIVTLLTYYFLARKSIFAVVSWLGVAGAALAIWRLHANPSEIAKVMVVATSIVLFVQAALAWFSFAKPTASNDRAPLYRRRFIRQRSIDSEPV